MKQSSPDRARIRRLRKQYRKRMVAVAIIFLIIGLVLGVVADRTLLKKDADAPRVVEVMVTPTPAPETAAPDIGSFGDDVDGGFGGGFGADLGGDADDFDEDLGDFDDDFGDEGFDYGEPEPEPGTEGTGTADTGADDTAAIEAADAADTAADDLAVGLTIDDEGADDTAADAVAAQAADAQADAGQAQGDGLSIALTTPEPAVTSEPTPEPTPTPTPEPENNIVPFGESVEFATQIKRDGTARIAAGDDPFETISFTMKLTDYMLPSDFAEKWGSVYKLQGTEAGAGFELTLNNYTGTAAIIPQNIIKIAFVPESGSPENLGFQLMDAEISGNLEVALETNVPKILWKRYTYSNAGEPLKYLAVTTYNNGVPKTYLFELKSSVAPTPDPLDQYTTLTRGDKRDEVIDLQKRLIDLGYLSGSADGNYGAKTQDAVRAAQKRFGMDETGTATPEFQLRLFTDEEPEPTEAPAPEEAPEEAPAEEPAED